MNWFRIDSNFSRHPKTLRLCMLLGDHNAGMYVVRLMEHCAEYATDGLLKPEVVEYAAGWRKTRSPGRLLSALLEAGFVDASGELHQVHGWGRRNGSLVRKSLKDNERPNQSRRNPDETPRGVSNGNSTVRNDTEKQLPYSPPPVAVPMVPPAAPAATHPATVEAGEGKATGRAGKAASPAKPIDIRHGPVREMLKRVYAELRQDQELPWSGREGGAMARLLAAAPSATPQEFERRWRHSLSLQRYPGTSSPMQFFQRWAELVPGAEPGVRRVIANVSDFTREENKQW